MSIQRGPKVTLVPAGRSTGVIKDFKDLINSKELLQALLNRELAGKYKGSFLGLGWTLVRPLVMLFIYAVVIGEFLGASRSIEQFAIFVLVGLLFWNLISDSINMGAVSMTINGNLLKKVWFPREVLPLTSFAVATVHFLVQVLVLIFADLIFGSWPSAQNLLFLIPADSDDHKKEFEILKHELEKFNPELLQKEFIIAISKSDLLDQELTDAIVKELPKKIPHIFISSATQKNLVELKDVLWKALNKPI
jgi:hypothetical protein